LGYFFSKLINYGEVKGKIKIRYRIQDGRNQDTGLKEIRLMEPRVRIKEI